VICFARVGLPTLHALVFHTAGDHAESPQISRCTPIHVLSGDSVRRLHGARAMRTCLTSVRDHAHHGGCRCRSRGRGRLSSVAAAVGVLLVSFSCAWAQNTAGSEASRVTLPRIEANGNLSPAGQLQDGLLTIRLEIREGDWYPEAETGPSVAVQAFAEEGRALQIPGPLIRVPEGTEVRATVRNALDKATARLYGLHGRPGEATQPFEIPAGDVREVRFKLTTPGTYHYWATTTGRPMERRFFADSQLSGALVVDPPGDTSADRVFVIGIWLDPGVRGASPRNGQNGRASTARSPPRRNASRATSTGSSAVSPWSPESTTSRPRDGPMRRQRSWHWNRGRRDRRARCRRKEASRVGRG